MMKADEESGKTCGTCGKPLTLVRKYQCDYCESHGNERDQFAIEFADYMENERWKHDYREQKTHTVREHLDYFKAKYY